MYWKNVWKQNGVLKTTNNKLFNRAVRTVAEIGKISCEEAEKLLIECNEDINRCLEKLEGCD